jgi:hypothetical protein
VGTVDLHDGEARGVHTKRPPLAESRVYDILVSRQLWRRTIAGDALRSFSLKPDRVLVSTGLCSVAFDEDGQVLQTTEVHEVRAVAPLAWLDRRGYHLSDGALVCYDAESRTTSRAMVPIEPFTDHKERLVRSFLQFTDEKIRQWDQFTSLVADPEHERLIFTKYSIPPWLGALRPDGSTAWVRVMGKNTDCCNQIELASSDGTIAHHSSCGCRLTFVDCAGATVSSHELGRPASGIATERKGVVYLSFIDGGVGAYQIDRGPLWTLDIPMLCRAAVRDGVVYAVTDNREGEIAVSAFAAPTA